MPEFAEINTQTYEVIRVILAESKIWCEYKLQGYWVETYRHKEGKNYGSIGYTYHPDKDNFSSPQPYPSWTLNNQCIWQAPLPYPSDDKIYIWNEEMQSWDDEKTYQEPTSEQINIRIEKLKIIKSMRILRKDRNIKLLETDKYSIPDWPHQSEEIKQSWMTYRQALRDLTNISNPQLDSDGFVTNVTWPIPPS